VKKRGEGDEQLEPERRSQQLFIPWRSFNVSNSHNNHQDKRKTCDITSNQILVLFFFWTNVQIS
jgi:hypothetical protein